MVFRIVGPFLSKQSKTQCRNAYMDTVNTVDAHEHTSVMQKWPHYKIKYRKKITKTYEKKIFE
jgi:tRNA A22 N-methylase